MQVVGSVGSDATVDYRGWALKRAVQLGIFQGQNAPSIFDDDCTRAPGISGSLFQVVLSTGAGSVATLPAERGGVWRALTAGTANALENVIAGAGNVISGIKPGMIDDPGASGSRWYLFAAFRVSTTVDNKTTIEIGFRPSDNTANNVISFGVDGVFESTTLFMAEENVLNATLSSVAIGSASTWHFLEAWQLGVANQVFFAFDGEAAKVLTMTAPFNAKGTLFVLAGNGATAAPRSVDIDHLTLLMPGNISLPM